MKKYDFKPVKRLGQNFLVDNNVVEKILLKLEIDKDDTVIEIGPGLGALTARIGSMAGRVVAVDIDRKLCGVLSDILSGSNNIEVINKDILEFDFGMLSLPGKVKVVGNLPYYITTPIISWMLENKSVIEKAFIMVQKELAYRMTARPGGKDYGSLSCYVQFYTRPDILMDVRRGSFFPEPDIDSCIVRMVLLDKPAVDVKDEDIFFKVVHAGFQQRRKTLLNSLSGKSAAGFGRAKVNEALKICGIDPKRRAETLGLRDFAAIADQLYD